MDGQPTVDAMMRAVAAQLAPLLTAPLTRTQIAYYFDVGRNGTDRIIRATRGVKKIRNGDGRRTLYRFPINMMPPLYLRETWPELGVALFRTESHADRSRPHSAIEPTAAGQ